jgi:hypothetical protein
VDLVARGRQPVYLDYPVRPLQRYGWGRPRHPELEALVAAGRGRCAELLGELHAMADGLRAIPVAPPADPSSPYWDNHYVGSLDAATLYGFPVLFGSRRYVEIGSGNSTKFVRRSVVDHGLDLRVVSIDPSPRAEVDDLCDEVVREGLESASLEVFDTLEANDILMCDGSHRCLQNSDVTVFFLEVLPRLRPGVLVYIDDVYLPCDYPSEWEARYYSEQYLLAVLLLADAGRRYEVVFPGFFTALDSELSALAERFWRRAAVPGLEPLQANGFWLRIRG